ncbi:MAG: sigma-70 family RNA polymerase sigma factor [Sphingobacteriia bacterium]|jgi:RNA polymerase sigma factor (sigma-70 family)|nr:sigma-70 family RNA polymerase sigma factor [Sphingobacteriia bacterium]
MNKNELFTLTDHQIIESLIQGNSQVIQYLFYEKCSSMFGYIIKEIFSYKVDKDELVNELYIYLSEDNWKKVREFEGRSKFTTWLSVISVRYFCKKKRDRIDFDPRKAQIDEAAKLPNTTKFDSFVCNMDLYGAINKLKNPRDRFVLMSLEIREQTVEEVAKALNISVDNLYNVRRRAKKHLSNILTEYKYEN